MAQLLKMKSKGLKEFRQQYLLRNSQAEEKRWQEHQAATCIQSWFRACKVHAYIRHLHKKAIIIQKIWRGFTARARFRQMVKEAYFIMKMNFYEEMAVRIQRRWRGFYVRKYVHNFYARKNYLAEVSWKNKVIRSGLDELEELQKRERDCLDVIKEQTNKVYQAHRLHHLLSTKQRPGIFNSPFRPGPHETELLLRQVKYHRPTRLTPSGKTCLLGIPDSTAPSLASPGRNILGTCSSRPILPPIASKKQMLLGVQKQPGEVWEQCVRCPDLMRLQSSYAHLEEAKHQLQQYKSMNIDNGMLFEQYTDAHMQN
ncbi:spermatogenesis-associated protein 17 [Solea solea]|uniref:spermatogenesis-associated protein 17 n=1 Tax=Solea solea TaxID=90069 RepID=UPI00272D67B9|nr:spermatogenesis-associated protein 17 [Solea solea]